MLAPDSYVDGDMQTGSVDGKKARNIYFIGDMPVDQQQRADRFWQRADQILKEYGFAKWQGCQSAGLPALIERILDDFDGNDDFSYDEKRSAAYNVSIFMARRNFTIRTMKRMQDEADSQNLLQQYDVEPPRRSLLDKKKTLVASAQVLLSKVIGHESNGLQEGAPDARSRSDSRKTVAQQIKNVDCEYEKDFRRCIKRLREIVIDSRKRINQSKLTEIYGGESRLQNLFWEELSEVLARNNIDPYDESASQLARFILDLPKLAPDGSRDQLPSTEILNKLYGVFQGMCSQRYAEVETTTYLRMYAGKICHTKDV